MLTQATFKSIFNYSSETGEFKRISTGETTGTLDKSTGYVRIWCCGKLYHAHRCVFLYVYGEFPKNQVDHIDGVRSNNKISNLRLATNTENNWNKRRHPKNTSGYRGVYFSNQDFKWKAKIVINSKQIHLGTFKSPSEASEAYEKFAKEIHGDFYSI